MRALKANLWQMIEWAAVLATLAWLLAHARIGAASPSGKHRRMANPLRRRKWNGSPVSFRGR